jgi:hypothetical protein
MIETERTRLIRLLRMFSSTFDGEGVSAARRAHELVKTRELDWDELIVKDGATGSSRARRSHTTSQIDDIRHCQERIGHLTQWKAEFISRALPGRSSNGAG